MERCPGLKVGSGSGRLLGRALLVVGPSFPANYDVRVRRAQIDVEAGRRVEAFVPQEHAPGAEAEVDFGEVWVVLNGVKTKCHMFVFRLSNSGKAIHRIYPTQAQVTNPGSFVFSRGSP
jgi:hypothetical protein